MYIHACLSKLRLNPFASQINVIRECWCKKKLAGVVNVAEVSVNVLINVGDYVFRPEAATPIPQQAVHGRGLTAYDTVAV